MSATVFIAVYLCQDVSVSATVCIAVYLCQDVSVNATVCIAVYLCQDVSVSAMILSAQFWPTFREEKITLPEHMQKLLEEYTRKFEAQKGNRTLDWKSHLGKNVNVYV